MRAKPWLLAGAGLLYVLAAWTVAPGFYDGIAPPATYCFVSPPPNVQNCSDHPRGGQMTLHVTGGVVDPGSVFTADGQAELSFRPGAFNAPSGGRDVTVKLEPVSNYPATSGAKFLTNVYLISANSSLTSVGALVTLRYSADQPAPSYVYEATAGTGRWVSLGSTNTAAPYFISANTSSLGYFAAGYPSNSTPPSNSPRVGGGQSLPLLVALGVVIVIVAVLPLALMRRRGETDGDAEDQ